MADKQEVTSIKPFKVLFLGINILMGLIGFACLTVGIYIRYSSAEPQIADIRITTSVAYLLIFGGFFSMLISMLGCVGAGLESTCILVLYFFIAVAMFILLIAIGIYSFKQVHEKTNERVSFIQSIQNYHNDENDKNAVDKVHEQRNCCGIKNPIEDFNKTIPESCNHGLIQESESSTTVSTVTEETTTSDSTASVGTKKYRLCSTVPDYIATAGGLALGFAIVVSSPRMPWSHKHTDYIAVDEAEN